jgi:hypothetical protein
MSTPKTMPSHDAISERARTIWASAGQVKGQDLVNWLQAEKELLNESAIGSSLDVDAVNGIGSGGAAIPYPRTSIGGPLERLNKDRNSVSEKPGRRKP